MLVSYGQRDGRLPQKILVTSSYVNLPGNMQEICQIRSVFIPSLAVLWLCCLPSPLLYSATSYRRRQLSGYDVETFYSISNKPRLKNHPCSLSLPMMLLILAIPHVPRSLSESCRIRDLLGSCDLDASHLDHKHRLSLVIQHQSKHARLYKQALLKTTLYQGSQ